MSAARTTNLTDMSLNRAIFSMALPAAGSMMVHSLYHLVDTFWVGKLGAGPLAAVSATSFFVWMFFSLADIAGVSANALVARAVGAGRADKIKAYVRDCVVVSVVVSVAMSLLLLPSMRAIFVGLDLQPQVIDSAVAYITPFLFFLPVILLTVTVDSIFRAVGDAKTPFFMMLLLVALNAVLDPLFIFGFGPVPALGLVGAAWVTVINQTVFVVVGVTILARRGLWFRPDRTTLAGMTWLGVKQVFRIGSPIALNGSLFAMSYVGLTWVIAQFGSDAVAAIGMGHRMEAFPWFVSRGFSVAAAALVGQYLGANQPKMAEVAVWKSTGIALVGIFMFFAAMMLAAEPIVRWFIDDAEVVAISSVYLRIVAACWLVGLLEVVIEGGFSGAGDTLPPLVIGVPFTLFRIPLAYWFAVSLGMGAEGVWWSIGLSMVIKGTILALWFWHGNWKRAVVH